MESVKVFTTRKRRRGKVIVKGLTICSLLARLESAYSLIWGNCCGKILREIVAGKSCVKFLREIVAGNCCEKILREILAGNSCGKWRRGKSEFKKDSDWWKFSIWNRVMGSQPISIQLGKILWENLAGNSCRKFLQENLVGKSCRKILWEILAGKSCGKFLQKILWGKSCRKNLQENLAGKSHERISWDREKRKKPI